MTAAQPSERLWTSDNDEYDGDEVSEVHNRMPESFTEEVKVPEGTRYEIGQEVSEADMMEIHRFESGFPGKGEKGYDRRDITLPDGFEARVQEMEKGRYKIINIWKPGEDPYK